MSSNAASLAFSKVDLFSAILLLCLAFFAEVVPGVTALLVACRGGGDFVAFVLYFFLFFLVVEGGLSELSDFAPKDANTSAATAA